jgi:hypothetical protein
MEKDVGMRLACFWPHDLDGYRIVEEVPKPRKPGQPVTLLERTEPITWIVAVGERAPEIRDRLLVDGIWRRLADTEPSVEGALGFVTDFGFLASKRRRESAEFICQQVEVMRSVVTAIDREDWDALDLWLTDHGKTIRLRPEFRQKEDWPRPDLFFAPDTLLNGIYLKALQDATGGTELVKCDMPGCPEWFAVGPRTGHSRVKRASGLRFCTPKCQKAHAYLRKKGELK